MTKFIDSGDINVKATKGYATVSVMVLRHPSKDSDEFKEIRNTLHLVRSTLLELGMEISNIDDNSIIFDGSVITTSDNPVGVISTITYNLFRYRRLYSSRDTINIYIEDHEGMTRDPDGERSTLDFNL